MEKVTGGRESTGSAAGAVEGVAGPVKRSIDSGSSESWLTDVMS